MKTKLMVLVLMFAITFTVPVMGRAATIELKVGHLSAVGGIEDLAVQKIREVVEQKTKGAIKVKVFPGAQLGNFVSQMEGVHSGTRVFNPFRSSGVKMGFLETTTLGRGAACSLTNSHPLSRSCFFRP